MKGEPVHHRWRQDVQEGELLGPQMVIASTLIDGPDPIWPGSVAVSREAEARRAVQQAQQKGADFIKVYSLLPRAAFFALVDEAHQRDIVFAGHVPDAITAGLLAGTDALNPFCFPGFSRLDELELLVEAGLTPMQALQAATRNPAEYLGDLDRAGTIAPGKRADLVLLDADPLADIRNTRRINAVIAAGVLLPKQRLDAMLTKVETLAPAG